MQSRDSHCSTRAFLLYWVQLTDRRYTMRKAMGLLVVAAMLYSTDGEARLPNNIDGVRLGWSMGRITRHLKKKGWKLTSNKRVKCGRNLMLRGLGGDVFGIRLHRGRMIAASKIIGDANIRLYTTREWRAKMRRLKRKYGKPKEKVLPVGGGVYAFFYRWTTRRRWYSISGNLLNTRPPMAKEVIFHIKDRRGERKQQRCRGK